MFHKGFLYTRSFPPIPSPQFTGEWTLRGRALMARARSPTGGRLHGSRAWSPDIATGRFRGMGLRWEESRLWDRKEGMKRGVQGPCPLKPGSCAGPTPWASRHFSSSRVFSHRPHRWSDPFLSTDDTKYIWAGQTSVLPPSPSKQTHKLPILCQKSVRLEKILKQEKSLLHYNHANFV